MKGEARTMETTMTREPIWKLWVDTQRRVVSFHEEAGSQPTRTFRRCFPADRDREKTSPRPGPCMTP